MTKAVNRNLDMTQGKPLTMLIRFAVPLLLGNLFQQLYNVVDSIVVGQFVGSEALAAVGTSMPVLHLLVSLFMGVGTGASILISQFFGAREFDKMRKAANTTLALTFFAGLALMVIGFFSAPYLLTFMRVEETYYDMALGYMRVLMLGVMIMLFYNIISGILRGLGDSRSPLIFLAIASVLNVILDLVFVLVFNGGVVGVALATLIAQLVSVIFAFFRLGRVNEHLKVRWAELRIDKKLAWEVVRLGLPSGLQMSIMSVAMMLQQGMINSFGMAITACFNATMRVDMFVMMPMMSMGMALTTYVGQNFGARDMGRVKQGLNAGLMICATVGIGLCILLFFFGQYLMRLFTSDMAVLEPGVQMLRFLSFFYPFVGFTNVFSGLLRGVGETKQPMYNSIVSSLLIRLPLGFLLMNLLSSHTGIFMAMGIGWAIGFVHMFLYYKFGKWRVRAESRMSMPPPDEAVAPIPVAAVEAEEA